MKNAEIVRALPQLKSLKIDLRIVEGQIKSLTKQREQLQDEIKILDSVDDVIDGIAVCIVDDANIYGKEYKIEAADRAIERSAEVYPNAHTSKDGVAKDWGLKLHGPSKPFGGFEEIFLGSDWPYKDAIEVARRWVTRNEVPSEEQQELHRTRHALDPEGRATKRRRLAFEAAWLAGHKQLAENILLGRVRPRTKTEGLSP